MLIQFGLPLTLVNIPREHLGPNKERGHVTETGYTWRIKIVENQYITNHKTNCLILCENRRLSTNMPFLSGFHPNWIQ